MMKRKRSIDWDFWSSTMYVVAVALWIIGYVGVAILIVASF